MSNENFSNTNKQAKAEQAFQAIYNYASNQLFNQKKSAAKVRNDLVEKGIPKEEAAKIVKDIQNEIFEAKSAAKRKNMIYGGFWLGGGLIVTVVSYMATGGEGSYVVTWGAMIYGAFLLIRAMAQD